MPQGLEAKTMNVAPLEAHIRPCVTMVRLIISLSNISNNYDNQMNLHHLVSELKVEILFSFQELVI